MKKRFIILLGSTTKEQEEAIRIYFAGMATTSGWWHWLPNTWLLYDVSGTLTAISLRNGLDLLLPAVYKLVLELNEQGDTWAGFGPNQAPKDMFDWIRRNWQKPKQQT